MTAKKIMTMKKFILVIISALLLASCSKVNSLLGDFDKACASGDKEKVEQIWQEILPLYRHSVACNENEKSVDNKTAYKVWKHLNTNIASVAEMGLAIPLLEQLSDSVCIDARMYILEQTYLDKDYQDKEKSINLSHMFLFNPSTMADWGDEEKGAEILDEYVVLTKKYDDGWEDRFYWSSTPKFVEKHLAEKYHDTKFGKKHAEQIEKRKRAAQRKKSRYSSVVYVPQGKYYYYCSFCGAMVLSTTKPKPNEGVCRTYRNGRSYNYGYHSWSDYAPYCPEHVYRCRKCGLQLHIDFNHRSYKSGCTYGRYHEFDKVY